jgi:hypothetical protein
MGVCLRDEMTERFILSQHTNTQTSLMNIWETWLHLRRNEELTFGKFTHNTSNIFLIEIIQMLRSRIYHIASVSNIQFIGA